MNIIKKNWKQFKKWFGFYKPDAATWDEWVAFNKKFKSEAPIRYFFDKTLFVSYYHIACIPYIKVREFIRYRTIRRYHVVDTGLKPGYYDKDELMLHACFSLLVDYVEVECANMEDICFNTTTHNIKDKIKEWFEDNLIYIFKERRNPEAGVKYLTRKINDQAGFCYEDDYAKKALEVYNWYINVRPHRDYPPDPMADSPGRLMLSDEWKTDNPELYDQYVQYLKECHKFDLKWKEEDDEMILKVLAIRRTLWT